MWWTLLAVLGLVCMVLSVVAGIKGSIKYAQVYLVMPRVPGEVVDTFAFLRRQTMHARSFWFALAAVAVVSTLAASLVPIIEIRVCAAAIGIGLIIGLCVGFEKTS